MASKFSYEQLIREAYRFRNNPTYHEQVALSHLDTKPWGFYKFQVVYGWYVLDFVIPSKLLVIELDGVSHVTRGLKDIKRDKFCNETGLRVLRLSNCDAKDILKYIDKYPYVFGYQAKFNQAVRLAKQRRLEDEASHIKNLVKAKPFQYKRKK